MISREDRQVGRLARRNRLLSPEYACRASRKKLHHANQRQTPGMNELQRQRQSGFESRDAKGSAIEFDLFDRGLMGRVVRGDGIHGAVSEPFDQRCAIVLNEFDPKSNFAEITVVYFPGDRASLKERPYYDEVLHGLRRAQETAASEAK